MNKEVVSVTKDTVRITNLRGVGESYLTLSHNGTLLINDGEQVTVITLPRWLAESMVDACEKQVEL